MEELLGSIGLSKTESKIYLTLLERGEQKTSEIISSTKINSGRIYEILSTLQSKGFTSKIIKNGIKYFSAAPPTILQDYLKEKEIEIEKEKKEIDTLLPKLLEKYSSNKKETQIEVFTGKSGMKSAYEILFAEATHDKNLYVTGISSQLNYAKWLPNFMLTYTYPKRKRLKLKTKKLMNIEAKEEKLWRTDKAEVKFIPTDALTSYEILGDVIIIQILQGDTVHLVIKDKQVANDFKKQFLLMWKNAKS